jgi:hypothetical protein
MCEHLGRQAAARVYTAPMWHTNVALRSSATDAQAGSVQPATSTPTVQRFILGRSSAGLLVRKSMQQ